MGGRLARVGAMVVVVASALVAAPNNASASTILGVFVTSSPSSPATGTDVTITATVSDGINPMDGQTLQISVARDTDGNGLIDSWAVQSSVTTNDDIPVAEGPGEAKFTYAGPSYATTDQFIVTQGPVGIDSVHGNITILSGDPSGSGVVTWTGPPPAPQPDVVLSKDAILHGDGDYAAGQTLPLKVRAGKSVRFTVLIQDDGNVWDNITVTATPPANKFRNTFIMQPNTQDVTSQLEAATFKDLLVPGSQRQLDATIATRPSAASGAVERLKITATSGDDPAISDTFTVKITVR